METLRSVQELKVHPMTTKTNTQVPRQLDLRISGDLEISLYWNPEDGQTTVLVRNLVTAETATFEVPAEAALDAFHHPFTHRAPNPTNGSGRTWSLRTIWA
jgi:hypothetical protein